MSKDISILIIVSNSFSAKELNHLEKIIEKEPFIPFFDIANISSPAKKKNLFFLFSKIQLLRVLFMLEAIVFSKLRQSLLLSKYIDLRPTKIRASSSPKCRNQIPESSLSKELLSRYEVVIDLSGVSHTNFNKKIEHPCYISLSYVPLVSFRSGFIEVVERLDYSPFWLLIEDRINGTSFYKSGKFPTRATYTWNSAQTNAYTLYLLQFVLENFENLILKEPSNDNTFWAESKEVTATTVFKYFFGTFSYYSKRLFAEKILRKKDSWQVGYQYSEQELILVPNPKGSYLADPFIFSKNNCDYLLVEEYLEQSAKGVISAYSIVDGSPQRHGVFLEEDFHLSYPFTFVFENNVYLMPEASSSKSLRIYLLENEISSAPQLVNVAFVGFSLADSSIFEHFGRWWLITNIDVTDTGDHCTSLYIYSSDNPISGKWHPHKNNPIYLDASIARNGGFFKIGTKAYRVGQSQGFDTYGSGAKIFEITELSSEKFVEVEIEISKFHEAFNAKSTHHLHKNNGRTVFDIFGG